MSSLARENISITWMNKLQALSTFLRNPWCCASLVAFVAVACFLSTGMLWPAAALLSSVLTAFIQGSLERQSQRQHPRIAHPECLTGSQLGTYDENSHGNATGGSIPEKAGIVAALGKDITTCASSKEDFAEIVKQSSPDIGEPSVETRLDHVRISLKRSESEDWGFAWQVGAYGAKRLILVNIGASSPMDSCNASRQAHGHQTIALGDELVCVDTDTEFGAMQTALDSATSLELTFLKAHAVKPVLLSAGRRGKRRLSIERKAMPFNAVVTTKNTFINFHTAETDSLERFARSDPTPMSCMFPMFSRNDDQSDEAETMSADNLSLKSDESDSFSESYTHFDTMDIQEVIKQMPKEDRSLLSDVQSMEEVEANSTPHFDTMDLQQQTAFPLTVPHETEIVPHEIEIKEMLKKDRSLVLEMQCVEELEASSTCKFDAIDLPAFPETPHFDTIGLHDFKEETNCIEDRPMLSEVQYTNKNPIRLADLLMEPGHVESSFTPGTHSSSFEQAPSLEFHSSHASCYTNNLANNVQQSFLLPSSQCLGTQPILTPSWRETANVFSLMGHEKKPNNNALAYHDESLLQGHCNEIAQKFGSFKDGFVPSLETKMKCKTQQKETVTRAIIPQVGEDWYCPECFDLQFKANLKCRMCGLPREHGVTELAHLDADRFLQGHNVTTYVATRFRSLAPNLQQTVMSGGSLHGARDPTAVLSNRIRKAEALASTAPSRENAPIKLGFDRKQKTILRHFPAGGEPSD